MDYIFYKIYLYYKKKKYIPVVMGIGFLFVLEVFIFLFLAMFFNFITDQLFSTKYLSSNRIEVFCYSIYTISAVLLIYRYGFKERRERIIEKCNNGKDVFKTWQIALLPILFLTLSVWVMAAMSHR